jgi:glycosyltransferase involved in cell wall biosynthesis
LPADAVVVGVPGTLRPIKGHLFFLDAFAAIASRCPELHALISGELCDADYGRALHAAIAKYDLQSRLHLTGPVADMRRFYAACDVVCVPSRAESFGRTVVESFATGVPLVASNVGGIAEIVTPEKTGLLIEFGDVVALSSSLSRLLDDAELRNRFARAARADSEQRFHESAYARRILSIVQQLLTAHSAQPIVSANENRALVS